MGQPYLVASVEAQGLEGLVATQRQPLRTGDAFRAWQKMRVNQGQEFVIGGYTHGTEAFDALVFGVFEKAR
jgi:ATP-dependent DNA ligase